MIITIIVIFLSLGIAHSEDTLEKTWKFFAQDRLVCTQKDRHRIYTAYGHPWVRNSQQRLQADRLRIWTAPSQGLIKVVANQRAHVSFFPHSLTAGHIVYDVERGRIVASGSPARWHSRSYQFSAPFLCAWVRRDSQKIQLQRLSSKFCQLHTPEILILAHQGSYDHIRKIFQTQHQTWIVKGRDILKGSLGKIHVNSRRGVLSHGNKDVICVFSAQKAKQC